MMAIAKMPILWNTWGIYKHDNATFSIAKSLAEFK